MATALCRRAIPVAGSRVVCEGHNRWHHNKRDWRVTVVMQARSEFRFVRGYYRAEGSGGLWHLFPCCAVEVEVPDGDRVV